MQVLNYTVQQHRLFTQLANAYALQFSGSLLLNLMEQFKVSNSSDNLSPDLLAEVLFLSFSLQSKLFASNALIPLN